MNHTVIENSVTIATYSDKAMAEATACQHICTHVAEMKEQIALVEELIKRGKSARALSVYQGLLKAPKVAVQSR